MSHSYEEIRSVALDILSGREKNPYRTDQFNHFELGVAAILSERESGQKIDWRNSPRPHLTGEDGLLFLELFWDLFRQGIISLGLDSNNREFPFFHVTNSGKRMLENTNGYFFHDVSSYEKVIRDSIPKLDDVTLLYLKEAMQAFQVGCLLSTAVMVGVATEHSFLKLLEAAANSRKHGAPFKSVGAERTILQKITKFKNVLDQQKAILTPELREDFETNFLGLLSMIRNFRNESGHPSGKIISREQCFVLLQVFVPCCKKIYQLMDFFKKS